MGGAVSVRAERRGEGWRGEEGEGTVEKNAPLKAEWKLTPAPKWLRVRPPPPPPPGHVLPSFLKGGQGISVGVVGPVAAPSPRSAPPGPGPLPLALRDGRGFGGISPPRHSRHPAPDAGIAPAPHAAQPTPRTHPRYFFFLSSPPPAAHQSTGSRRGARRPPPSRPSRPRGLRPRLRRRGAEPAPALGSRKQQRLPSSSRGRAAPSPPAGGRGGARSGSRSLRAGAPRGNRPGRASGAARGESGCGESPAPVSGRASSPRGVTAPAPESKLESSAGSSPLFPPGLILIQRKDSR